MRYLTAEQALFIHARLIAETGGMHGVRDVGLLRSAVERPRATYGGKDLYRDLFRKAAALMESLVGNHPFLDGNKRTAITAAGLFLMLNGYELDASQKELEAFTLGMALRKSDVQGAAEWFRKHSMPKS
ncbi:MAG: type II toxin-antitoxin system death-on-curing family toxin [Nitrospirota bacterium]